jgi:hypothetical protein
MSTRNLSRSVQQPHGQVHHLFAVFALGAQVFKRWIFQTARGFSTLIRTRQHPSNLTHQVSSRYSAHCSTDNPSLRAEGTAPISRHRETNSDPSKQFRRSRLVNIRSTMVFSYLHPRPIAARHHHLNGHERGAVIALSAVVGLFAMIIAALVYVWRAQRARNMSKKVELEEGEIAKSMK